ncbi:MAG: hypothetical protein AAGD05_13640, partial [Bacteroidota bacterium]
MHRLLKSVFFFLCLALLLLPEYWLPKIEPWLPFSAIELGGVEKQVDYPDFSLARWFKGQYQSQYGTHLRQASPIRPITVRLRNQLDYALFHDSGNRNNYLGKSQFIFTHGYTDAYLGKDFVGEAIIQKKIEQLRVVQAYCIQQGLPLLFTAPPGKPRLFP